MKNFKIYKCGDKWDKNSYIVTINFKQSLGHLKYVQLNSYFILFIHSLKLNRPEYISCIKLMTCLRKTMDEKLNEIYTY